MRTIATEGSSFVVSVVHFLPHPEECGLDLPGWEEDRNVINGGSIIVNPYGDIIAGPLIGKEGLLTVEIYLETIVEAC